MPDPTPDDLPVDCPYVSRGGLKLQHALQTFRLDVSARICADLGCSTGGFTDCLLRAGAAHVFAVDTAYGEFAWKLRNDPRVTLLERSNALHTTPPPEAAGGVDLVVIDLGWTRQDKAIPAALRWLGPTGRIITLIKPHYESPNRTGAKLGKGAALSEAEAEAVAARVSSEFPNLGARQLALTRSPILGGKAGKGAARGNVEFLALLERA